MPKEDNRAFFRTVYPIWKDTVTSGHSAPYFFWGAFISIAVLLAPVGENFWVKLAVACIPPIALFASSAYAAARTVWQTENDKANRLEERLSPKISLSIPNDVLTIPAQNNALSKWVQVIVQSTTDAPLNDCEIWVTDIVRLNDDGTENSIFDEAARCLWSQHNEGAERHTLTIRPKIPQRANLFMLSEAECPAVPHPQLDFVKIILNAEIQTPGIYRISLVATAIDMPSISETLIFEWHNFDDVILSEEMPSFSSASAEPRGVLVRPRDWRLGSRR